MVMQRWNPRALATWRPFHEMEHALDRYFQDWPLRTFWRRGEMGWSPSTDVYEKDDSFVVRTELPGIDAEDIDISMSGNTLFIKGERSQPEGVEAGEYECCEVVYGSFSRSITFSEPVQADKVEASLEDGILEVRLPKMPEAKGGKIQIKAKGKAAKTESKPAARAEEKPMAKAKVKSKAKPKARGAS